MWYATQISPKEVKKYEGYGEKFIYTQIKVWLTGVIFMKIQHMV